MKNKINYGEEETGARLVELRNETISGVEERAVMGRMKSLELFVNWRWRNQ